MPTSMKLLADDDVRRTAIMVHDRSFLVEAGAGSGKTAIMAGRIAMLLAEGVAPKAIAAVTFTELAASELLFRVREFVRELALYRVPTQLHVALPVGLSEAQLRNITRAHFAIDEITCSTIHGFCQRLIKPYPVEADIDPGAIVMDRNQADLAFTEIGDAWLRQELASDNGGLLAEMVLEDPNKTEELIKTILGHLRRQQLPRRPGIGQPAEDALLERSGRAALHQSDCRVEQHRRRPAEPDPRNSRCQQ